MTRLDWIVFLGFCAFAGARFVFSSRSGKRARSKRRSGDNVIVYDTSSEYRFSDDPDSSVTGYSPTTESSDYECDATSSGDCSFDGGGDGGGSD
jgi:hypothetical protein